MDVQVGQELTMSARGSRLYEKKLCRTAACKLSWQTALQNLEPFLPLNEMTESYKSCAIVSSSKWLPADANPKSQLAHKKVSYHHRELH